jgi:hypothetical protein
MVTVARRPFRPDSKATDILTSALSEAHAWFDARYEAMPRFYPSGRWFFPADVSLVKASISGFADADAYPVDARGLTYYWGFSNVKRAGAGAHQIYLFATRDKDGNPLDGGRAYRLTVPPKVPVSQYWSATAYDRATHTLIRDVGWGSRSSLTPGLQTNADGSTDIWFAPDAPTGRESNWVPTKAGGSFEVIFRVYGAEKAAIDMTWKLPDIERA